MSSGKHSIRFEGWALSRASQVKSCEFSRFEGDLFLIPSQAQKVYKNLYSPTGRSLSIWMEVKARLNFTLKEKI